MENASTTPVFEVERPIALRIRRGADFVTVKVRFPNDEEWAERQRRRKVIVKQMGRGVSETQVPNGEDIDAALLAKVRTDEGQPEIDVFEAQKLIEQLSTADVEDVVPVGDMYVVTMRVLGATVKHAIKMPSAKDVNEYRRSFARVLDLPYGRQELTLNLKPVADMYKRLMDHTEGYVGSVPITHQSVAVKAAIDALDMSFQEDTEANF